MSKLKVRWRRTALHTLALVLCICGGAMQTATALGSPENLCAGIDAQQNVALQQIDVAATDLRAVWKTQDQRQQVLFDQLQTALSARYKQLDAARAANHSKLAEGVHTTAQQDALDTYRKQMQVVLQTRRDSVAAAAQAFREQVITSTTDRRAVLAGQTQAYRIAVNDAYTKAQGLCAAAVAPSEVSTELTTLLAKSQAIYNQQRTDDKGLEADLRAFAATREHAVERVDNAFRAQANAALRQLETGLEHSE